MAVALWDGHWGVMGSGNPNGDHLYQHSVDVEVGNRATLLDLTLMAGGSGTEALRRHHQEIQQKAAGAVLSDFVLSGMQGLHGVPLSAVAPSQHRDGSARRVYGGLEVPQALASQEDLQGMEKRGTYQEEEASLTLPGGQLNVGPHLPLLDGRFKYVESLSEGGSAKVFTALDMSHPAQRPVVVKAMHRHYRDVGLQEQQLLRFLNSVDPEDSCHIVRLVSGFDFQGHTCLVMERLHCSLLEHMCSQQRQAMDAAERVEEIRHMALHLVVALATIHSSGVIHGDLKPENVLLQTACPRNAQRRTGSGFAQTFGAPGFCGCVGNRRDRGGDAQGCEGVPVGVKLADFGNSFTAEQIKGLCREFNVQTLAYRSPEVLLGVAFDASIDMWSLGCIVAELAIGRLLFACESPAQLLQQMSSMLGRPPPPGLFSGGKFVRKLFQEAGLGISDGQRPPSGSPLRRGGTMPSFCHPGQSYLGDALLKIDPLLADLVNGMLQYDPAARLTAKEALMHPFFGPIFPFRSLFGDPSGTRLFTYGQEEETVQQQQTQPHSRQWEQAQAVPQQHQYQELYQQRQHEEQQQQIQESFNQMQGRQRLQDSQLATPQVYLQALGASSDQAKQTRRVVTPSGRREAVEEHNAVAAQEQQFGLEQYHRQEHVEMHLFEQQAGRHHHLEDDWRLGQQGDKSRQREEQRQHQGQQVLQQLQEHQSQLRGLLEQTLQQQQQQQQQQHQQQQQQHQQKQQQQQLLQHCQEHQGQGLQYPEAEYREGMEQERHADKQQRLNGPSRKKGLVNTSEDRAEALWNVGFVAGEQEQTQAQRLHQLRVEAAEQQLQYIQLQQHKQQQQQASHHGYAWPAFKTDETVSTTPGSALRNSKVEAASETHGVVPGMRLGQVQWDGVLTEQSFQPVAVQDNGHRGARHMSPPALAHGMQAPTTPFRVSEARPHGMQCCTIDMQPVQLEHSLLGAVQLQQQLQQQQEEIRAGEHLVQLQHLSWAAQKAASLQASRSVAQPSLLGLGVAPGTVGPSFENRASWMPPVSPNNLVEAVAGSHAPTQGLLLSCHGELQGFQQNVWYSQTPVL